MEIQIYYQKWDEKSKASHELLEHVIRIYAKAHQIKLPETLQIHQEKNKKPFLEHVSDICFSISHSGEWWSCAIAPQEVGLDIQEEHDCKAERLAKRFFHPMEVEWLEQHGYEIAKKVILPDDQPVVGIQGKLCEIYRDWACKGYGLLFGGEAGWHIDRRGKCLAKTDRLSIGVLYGCDSEAGSRNKAVFIDRTG